MIQLLPAEQRTDPIADTWHRGLIGTALEHGLRPLCWHIKHNEQGSIATGYVTVSLLHEATSIRSAWANQLELINDQHGNYLGQSGALTIALPDAIDPDEHCWICDRPFDPYDTSPTGQARYRGGDICCLCATQ